MRLVEHRTQAPSLQQMYQYLAGHDIGEGTHYKRSAIRLFECADSAQRSLQLILRILRHRITSKRERRGHYQFTTQLAYIPSTQAIKIIDSRICP